METQENTTPTPEELQVEQESLAEVQDTDLRSSLIDSLGLEDNEGNKDLIDNLVQRERDHRSKLSGAIGTKIKYREQLQQLSQRPEQTGETPEVTDKTAEQIVAERFNEEFLEDSDYGDEIKAEIREFAAYKGISAKAATKSPHIATMIEAEAQERKVQEAAKNGGGEKGGTKNGDTQGVPDRFTAAYMATEEGRKDYEEWSASN